MSLPSCLQHVASLLAEADLPNEHHDDYLFVPLPCKGRSAGVVIRSAMKGNVIKFDYLGLLARGKVADSPHKDAFHAFLFQQNWSASAGSFELDTDGEVRAVVELPLADAKMTIKQLDLILTILRNHGMLLLGMGERILEVGLSAYAEDLMEQSSSLGGMLSWMALMPPMIDKAKTLEGRDELQRLINDESEADDVRVAARIALHRFGPDAATDVPDEL